MKSKLSIKLPLTLSSVSLKKSFFVNLRNHIHLGTLEDVGDKEKTYIFHFFLYNLFMYILYIFVTRHYWLTNGLGDNQIIQDYISIDIMAIKLPNKVERQ